MLASTLVLAALAGCSTLKPVASTDAGNQAPFNGIRALAGDENSPPVRIFMVHGISNHEPGWALEYLDPIAEQMSWKCETLVPPTPVELPKPGGTGALDTTADYSAKLQVFTLSDSRRVRAIAYELTWSPLTINFKKTRLSPDDALQPKRTLVNGYLKEQVLNEDMSDVVLYLARYDNDILRRSVRAALEHFYRKDYDPPADKDRDENPVVFISESLGSMMLYGELQAEQKRLVNATALSAEDARDQAGFDEMVRHSRLFFMMANQLPLLDVNESTRYDHVPTAAEKGPLPQAMAFFGTLPPAVPGPGAETPVIDVVAFSDINDILSYPLDPDDVRGLPNVRLHLFAPVNTLMGFPFFERPDWAHTSYAGNPQVTAIVVDGYNPTGAALDGAKPK